MRYNGAEITIKLLERQGIDVIAGIPGGANLPIYDALYHSKIRHILVRHEQGGGFIAHGIARSTGKAAVCFATSGPGVMNLLTAVADAKIDSVPMVAVTGQVSSYLIGTDAFQEIDTYGLTIPITKHNFLVRDAADLFKIIPEAFNIAESGRPGPVVVDIPKDVQNQILEFDEWPEVEFKKSNYRIDMDKIEEAANMINNSKKPFIYIGGGIVHSNAHRLLYELAKKNNIPVASTLMGLGSFPNSDSLYLGMLGMHGARYTNMILNEADLILAFGVRFDDRATGNITKFCPNASIIHVDIDYSEINKLRKSDLYISSDISIVLKHILPFINTDKREHWLNFIENTKKEYPMILPPKDDLYHPINFIRKVSTFLRSDDIITTDVGQHQMWVAQSYPFNNPRTLLTSGGLGTMGFGLPSAIGAALAHPYKTVVCFSGDGSILMNIQELATLNDLGLNVKIIIMNNGHLGLVRQQQEMFYNQNYIASKFISNPDFADVAEGFGIKGVDLTGVTDPDYMLKEALTVPGPCLINVPINYAENVLPIVPPGAANSEMIGGEIL